MFVNLDSDIRIYGRAIAENVEGPNVIYISDVNEDSARSFIAEFQHIYSTGQEVIPVMIDSFGGEAYALLPILDVMKACDVPVATIAVGKAMSCGAWILAAGTKGYRYAYPSAKIMLHSLLGTMQGHQEELEASIRELKDLAHNLDRDLDKFCNQPAGHFRSKFDKLNGISWYLNAYQAKSAGLVDHIGVPKLSTKISVETSLSL